MYRYLFSLAALAALFGLLFLPESAFAAGADFGSRLIDKFYTKAASWEPKLTSVAKDIFKWIMIFEVVYMGLRAIFQRDQIADIIKQFVLTLFVAGFFLAVINNYHEWTWNMIKGLKSVGLELSGEYNAETPMLTGLEIVKVILNNLSLWSPGNSLALLIAACIIIICFALISGMVIVIKCEAMITMTAALIMVGFGASGLFRDFAVNTIRYAFAVAFKLFVMQLVLGVGISFIKEFETTTAQFQDIFVLIGAAVILYLLVKSLPDVCAGIISGSHVSSASASSVGGAMKAAGGTVLGAGLGAYAAGSSLRSASKLADMAGKTGLGKAGHMGKALFDAGRQVHREKTQMKGGALAKTNHIMQERLENARLSKDEEA